MLIPTLVLLLEHQKEKKSVTAKLGIHWDFSICYPETYNN